MRGRLGAARGRSVPALRVEVSHVTTSELHIFNAIYAVVLITTAVLTRATWRRLVGALAGGLAIGVVALAIIAFGEAVVWWHMAITWEPYFLMLLLIDFSMCAFIFLITWRISRRFGWRGLAVTSLIVAIVGPPRDYWYIHRFPE